MAELQGAVELRNALLRLSNDVEKKVLRKGAIAGARVVRDAVKSLAPVASQASKRAGGYVQPGTIKRAVTLKFANELSGRGKASYVVTIRRGKSQQKANRDAFYWLWVEQGHRVVGRSKRVIGAARPHPFFVPAYRATYTRAAQAMRTAVENGVNDVVNGKT